MDIQEQARVWLGWDGSFGRDPAGTATLGFQLRASGYGLGWALRIRCEARVCFDLCFYNRLRPNLHGEATISQSLSDLTPLSPLSPCRLCCPPPPPEPPVPSLQHSPAQPTEPLTSRLRPVRGPPEVIHGLHCSGRVSSRERACVMVGRLGLHVSQLPRRHNTTRDDTTRRRLFFSLGHVVKRIPDSRLAADRAVHAACSMAC
ncbi:hypothetical protein IWX90DRAFT_206424 [Phyllosticta citrichinensis]|uniref:Uncharacterized protein n=1 Tax=Phyllosticta citrichinensis TaxID=1130410 RepID=A0ABR1XSZ2_9PEZI